MRAWMPVIRILQELLSRLEDAEKYLVLLITPVRYQQ